MLVQNLRLAHKRPEAVVRGPAGEGVLTARSLDGPHAGFLMQAAGFKLLTDHPDFLAFSYRFETGIWERRSSSTFHYTSRGQRNGHRFAFSGVFVSDEAARFKYDENEDLN